MSIKTLMPDELLKDLTERASQEGLMGNEVQLLIGHIEALTNVTSLMREALERIRACDSPVDGTEEFIAEYALTAYESLRPRCIGTITRGDVVLVREGAWRRHVGIVRHLKSQPGLATVELLLDNSTPSRWIAEIPTNCLMLVGSAS